MNFLRLIATRAICSLVAAGMSGWVRAEDSTIQIRKTIIPAAITRLSTIELIDQLQNESGQPIDLGQGSSAVRFAALELGFSPLDAPAFAIVRNLKRYPASPVMAELVSRGVGSLPLLLEHLSDPRPTRCAQTLRFFMGGPGGFADKYDSRYREPDRQPKEVNLMTVEKFKALEKYVLRVGDLCYYAIGQIVNRRLEPISSGLEYNNRALTINSPVESAALAVATRAEWRGLTAAEHEAILQADAQADEIWPPHNAGEPALKRLLYYYPEAGKSEADRRLAAELDVKNIVHREWLVYELGGFDWPGLDAALHELFERAKTIQTDDAEQRFSRDELVLTITQKIFRHSSDQELSLFLAGEISFWEGWQKETVAAPWYRKPGEREALSNLVPETRRWCATALTLTGSNTEL